MTELIPNVSLSETYIPDTKGRFRAAFELAWARIPQSDQEAIQSYLKQFPATVYLCYDMQQTHSAETWGRCSYEFNQTPKTLLSFLAPAVLDMLTIEQTACLIAHELAHLCNAGHGTWTSDEPLEETNTTARALGWGFGEATAGRDQYDDLVALMYWRNVNHSAFGTFTEAFIQERVAAGYH